MAVELTALGRQPRNPPPHVCRACGSTRDACFGFAGDAWYCHPCVPAELRRPDPAGYQLPAIETAPAPPAPTATIVAFPARAARPAALSSAPDLFGSVPA